MRGIVLAASSGDAFASSTAHQPKCMLDVRGRPLLHRLLATLSKSGVFDVAVVRGYCAEAVVADGATMLDNAAFDETGEAASLACALPRLKGETVVVYGDVLFRRYILDELLESPADITIVVDSTARPAANPRDLVTASRRDNGKFYEDGETLLTGFSPAAGETCGEWIGLMHLSARGAELVCETLAAMQANASLASADLPLLLHLLAQSHPVAVHYIRGHWLDVDTPSDLAEARNFS